jgi:hydrogenase maturation protease HycI
MSVSLTADVRQALAPAAGGPTVLILVGNSLRSDDGVGSYLAKRLGSEAGGCRVLDAADRPENILLAAAALRPAKTVIIDAADFGGVPGEVRLIPRDRIPENTLTTHAFPLPVVAHILERDCGGEVLFLGIQPRTTALGEGLSPDVRVAADAIVAEVQGRDS